MNKQKTDWSKYVLQQIEARKKNDLSATDLYFNLFNIRIGDSNAKKRFTGIRNYINSCDKSETIDKSVLNSLESFELGADGKHTISKLVSASEEALKSPDRIMELLGYDFLKWELISSKHSMWNGGREDVTLYSLKCQVKPRKTKVSTQAITRLVESLDFSHIEIPEYKNNYEGELMLEIPLFDVHYNKKYDDNSNIETQKENYIFTIQDFIDRVDKKNISKTVLIVGQDFFNSDSNLRDETTAGTPQSNIQSHDEMFKQGIQLLIDGIELVRSQLKCSIDVIYSKGNHDELLAFYASVLLEKLYENVDNINVDSSIENRKYVTWGKCLIGFTHGHKEKKRLETENIMQIEMREAWGNSKFFEFHIGHLHHSIVKEMGGIIYRNIGSISTLDKWHKESGFVGANKTAQAFLWHKERGLLDIFHHTIIKE